MRVYVLPGTGRIEVPDHFASQIVDRLGFLEKPHHMPEYAPSAALALVTAVLEEAGRNWNVRAVPHPKSGSLVRRVKGYVRRAPRPRSYLSPRTGRPRSPVTKFRWETFAEGESRIYRADRTRLINSFKEWTSARGMLRASITTRTVGDGQIQVTRRWDARPAPVEAEPEPDERAALAAMLGGLDP